MIRKALWGLILILSFMLIGVGVWSGSVMYSNSISCCDRNTDAIGVLIGTTKTLHERQQVIGRSVVELNSKAEDHENRIYGLRDATKLDAHLLGKELDELKEHVKKLEKSFASLRRCIGQRCY
jgi:hypothetical protein